MAIYKLSIKEFVDAGYGLKDLVLSVSVGDAISLLIFLVALIVTLFFLYLLSEP